MGVHERWRHLYDEELCAHGLLNSKDAHAVYGVTPHAAIPLHDASNECEECGHSISDAHAHPRGLLAPLPRASRTVNRDLRDAMRVSAPPSAPPDPAMLSDSTLASRVRALRGSR